jgi:hypothetical protein
MADFKLGNIVLYIGAYRQTEEGLICNLCYNLHSILKQVLLL